jgi:hypothetical protein
MKNNPWIEFLVFTRKERIAVFTLSLLIIISAIAPVFIPEKKFVTPNAGEFYALKSELDNLKLSTTDSLAETGNESQPWQNYYSPSRIKDSYVNVELFVFDPNKNDYELQVEGRQIQTSRRFAKDLWIKRRRISTTVTLC